jgi:hypothetical protein
MAGAADVPRRVGSFSNVTVGEMARRDRFGGKRPMLPHSTPPALWVSIRPSTVMVRSEIAPSAAKAANPGDDRLEVAAAEGVPEQDYSPYKCGRKKAPCERGQNERRRCLSDNIVCDECG